MRSIMGKFSRTKKPIGEPFVGGGSGKLGVKERVALDQLKNGDMPHAEAKRLLKSMNPNTQMSSLLEFARLLAAVVKVYPERVDSKFDKTTMRASLVHAASIDRFGWYMNNAKYRSSLHPSVEAYMAVGTTRNEQMHAKLNAAYRGTVKISRRTLAAETNAWIVAEAALFARALATQTTRRVSRADLLRTTFSKVQVFNMFGWKEFSAKHAAEWVASDTHANQGQKRRKGPSDEQADIYDAIRKKTVTRKRARVL